MANSPSQMTFEERRRYTLAGKRKKRPGPKPASRPNVRHRVRPEHKKWQPVHVTLRGVHGLPSFRAQVLYPAFERAVRQTRREDFRIVEFSIQNNHVHLVVEADDNDALARGMKSFSVRANRLYNAAHGRMRGKVWSDRYHCHELKSPFEVRKALVYCLQNFKKHNGIAEGVRTIDACSSARWFRGWNAERTYLTDDDARPGELPRTQLLRILWKKHGLIDPTERPLPRQKA